MKGPAAATLYGIQASNGVVRITTKRGRAGKARWNLYSELGGVHDGNTYPINFNGRDNTAETGPERDGGPRSLTGRMLALFLDGFLGAPGRDA